VRPARIAARHAARAALALAGCLLGPRAALAQDGAAAPSATEREGWALVGIMAPELHRIGLLIPLTDRVLIRPDFQGNAFSYEGIATGWFANSAISVIIRTRPVDGSWVYASLRATNTVDVHADWEDVSHSFTLTIGAHARITSLISVFGEAGPAYTYDEDPPDTSIIRSYDLVARGGFALRRPPRR
jgi:hypothetical protein